MVLVGNRIKILPPGSAAGSTHEAIFMERLRRISPCYYGLLFRSSFVMHFCVYVILCPRQRHTCELVVRMLPNLRTRYFKNEWTDFDANSNWQLVKVVHRAKAWNDQRWSRKVKGQGQGQGHWGRSSHKNPFRPDISRTIRRIL